MFRCARPLTEEEVMNARRVLIPVIASFALAASAAPAGAAAGDGGQSGSVAPCLAFFTSHDPQLNGGFISALAQEGDLGSVVTDFSHERPC
jgi:hypothetical protein